MRIVVPKEASGQERRVALVPESVGRLVKAGSSVGVEQGAGTGAGFADAAYEAAGAEVVATPNPGCMMQIGAGLLLAGSGVHVVHPLELLAESYRRAEEGGE